MKRIKSVLLSIIGLFVLSSVYFGGAFVSSSSDAGTCSIKPTAEKPIPQKPEDICPVKTGESVNLPSVKTASGKECNLDKQVKSRPTLLIFYRGGWCPYCNLHLKELKKVEKQIIGKGVDIIALSPDRPEEVKKSEENHKLDFKLLSDSSMDAAKALGVAFRVDDETNKKLEGYSIDLAKASGESHRLLPVPSVFLLDKSGKVVFAHSNPDYKVRMNPLDILTQVNKVTKN